MIFFLLGYRLAPSRFLLELELVAIIHTRYSRTINGYLRYCIPHFMVIIIIKRVCDMNYFNFATLVAHKSGVGKLN